MEKCFLAQSVVNHENIHMEHARQLRGKRLTAKMEREGRRTAKDRERGQKKRDVIQKNC